MDSSMLKAEAYKQAYLTLKKEYEEFTNKSDQSILALAVEKTNLANTSQKYREIVDSLAEEIEKLSSYLKALQKAQGENQTLRDKIQILEEKLCTATLECNNAVIQNKQLKQSLKSLQGKVIGYITNV